MTVQDIIDNEVKRLVRALPEIDPLNQPDLYETTLDNLTTLMYLPRLADSAKEPEHPVDNVTPFPEPSTEEYEPPVMEGAVTTTKIAGCSLPESKLSDEPAKTYTMVEVRAALGKYRTRTGMDIANVLEPFGADNFAALPASKYPALMKYLEEN